LFALLDGMYLAGSVLKKKGKRFVVENSEKSANCAGEERGAFHAHKISPFNFSTRLQHSDHRIEFLDVT